MHQIISHALSSFELGEAQIHTNMTIVPVLVPNGGGPDYLTMREALDAGVLAVTEVSEGGSVPNLKVSNKSDKPVLLLDGEEVAGAKQNRVLNTTILVKERSEVVIPVSCTEQGRWTYATRDFYDSGNIMARNIRMSKNQSVSASYLVTNAARSDQGAIWNEINQMSHDAGAPSQTGAMKDVYEKRQEELNDYLQAFRLVAGQKGLMVFIGGAPAAAVGFDCLSLERAFAGLFPKLVKSYAMEAWLEGRKKKGKAEGAGAESGGKNGAGDIAKAFLAEAAACEEKSYDSVGMGKDYRYSGPRLVGSALAVEDAVIHMAFFRVTESEQAGNMAGMNRRRSFRV
jgi:hypothetical protein